MAHKGQSAAFLKKLRKKFGLGEFSKRTRKRVRLTRGTSRSKARSIHGGIRRKRAKKQESGQTNPNVPGQSALRRLDRSSDLISRVPAGAGFPRSPRPYPGLTITTHDEWTA